LQILIFHQILNLATDSWGLRRNSTIAINFKKMTLKWVGAR